MIRSQPGCCRADDGEMAGSNGRVRSLGGGGQGGDAVVARRRRGNADRTTRALAVDRVGGAGLTRGDPC